MRGPMGTRESSVKRKQTDNPVELRQALAESERRFEYVIELSSDYYWEQDERYRFTVLREPANQKLTSDTRRLIRKTRWELGGEPIGRGSSWAKHRALLTARKPFVDFVVRYPLSDGRDLYINTSGRPFFD